jgi:hypothetical protein
VRWALIWATALCLLGCSSPGPATPATPPPPPALHSDGDQRAAEQAVLTPQDVGSDYRTSPFVASASSRQEDAALSQCLGRPPTAEHETARAFSPVFSKGDAQQILVGVTFVDSVATAHDDLAALAYPARAPECLRASLLRQLGRDATVEVTPVVPSPGGEGGVTWRMRVVAGPPPAVVDVVSVARGRAEVSLSFQDVNQPVPGEVQDRLMGAVLGRLPGV